MNRLLIFSFAAILVLAVLGRRHVAAQDDPVPPPVRALAFSPDGKHLAIGFGLNNIAGGLLLWDVEGRTSVFMVRHEVGLSSIAFSPDGKLIAFSLYGQPPRVMPAGGGDMVTTLDDSHRGPVAFSADSQTLATGSVDKTVRLWDVESGRDRQSLAGADDLVRGLAFSGDGALLVAACGSAGVYLWNLNTGEAKSVYKHGASFVPGGLISPDGRAVITAGWDGTTRVWDSATGKERARLGVYGGRGVTWSPRTGQLAACNGGKSVELFGLVVDEPSPDQRERVNELLGEFENDDYAVRDAASDELVALGFGVQAELQRAAAESPSAEIRIRARRARQEVLSKSESLLGHKTGVYAVAFSPDGASLASGSEDGVVILWDVAARKEASRISVLDIVERERGSKP